MISSLFMLAPLVDNGPFGDRRAVRRYIDRAADECLALEDALTVGIVRVIPDRPRAVDHLIPNGGRNVQHGPFCIHRQLVHMSADNMALLNVHRGADLTAG